MSDNKPVPVPAGVEWPVTDKSTGKRSTEVTGQEVFAASVASISPAAAQQVRSAKNWRFTYDRYAAALSTLSLLLIISCPLGTWSTM
jgi:hypothetical protein